MEKIKSKDQRFYILVFTEDEVVERVDKRSNRCNALGKRTILNDLKTIFRLNMPLVQVYKKKIQLRKRCRIQKHATTKYILCSKTLPYINIS